MIGQASFVITPHPFDQTKHMYTLEDLAKAKDELSSLRERSDNYSGNNPNRFRADISDAQARLHSIEEQLKATGLLARSAQELLEAQLDAAFPKAQSRQVVTWEGKRYMRRFSPVATSLSGKTVKAWHKFWEEMADDQQS
jgi:hypothetical protein